MIWQHTWNMYALKDSNYKPFSYSLLAVIKAVCLYSLLLPEIESEGTGLSRIAIGFDHAYVTYMW